LQGLNLVEKSQNLEPVKKPVNFKTYEKTCEKTCEQNRLFSLSHNKKINQKPSSGKSYEIMML